MYIYSYIYIYFLNTYIYICIYLYIYVLADILIFPLQRRMRCRTHFPESELKEQNEYCIFWCDAH